MIVGVNKIKDLFDNLLSNLKNKKGRKLDILEKEDISNYETIVIDTLGKMVDRIGDWLAISNPKVKQADGQLAMKGWGNIKAEFQRLLKVLESKNKSVIFIAHEKEEKNGDETKKRPDVAGSSGKDIVNLTSWAICQ